MINTKVKVNTDKLINTLLENKAKHIQTYIDAVKVFQVDYQERLKEMISNEKHEMHVNLSAPVSYEKEYDKLINVLRMQTELTIDIGSEELSRVINDEWDWKRGFDATTSLYLAKAGK